MFAVLGLCVAVTACSEGVEGAASFTFGPPDSASGDPIDNNETSSTGNADPTVGTGGSSDPTTPGSTGQGGETSDDTSGSPGETDNDTSGTPGSCEPGETQACYSGPDGTENVGICVGGTQSCNDDGTWGACDGETTPATEDCNGEDDDCDGAVDNGNPDGGDACNTGIPGPCQPGVLVCEGGQLVCEGNVSPAPSETCGNGVDDDCSGAVDDGCGCDPGNPAADCAANESCFPTEVFGDEAVCAGPMGAGGQYATCVDNSDCAPGHVCVDVGTNVYCLQWCTSFAQCPGALDDCATLDPTVWDENQEWGVCYDGLG